MLCAAINVFQAIAKLYGDHIKRKDYDYGELPTEIISNILSRLRTEEFQNASIACKSWYAASCDSSVIKNIRVKFEHNSTHCDYLVRPICNARFNSINWNKLHYRKIFRKFSSTITELEINSVITPTQLFEIFIYLPNVSSLKVVTTSKHVSLGNYDRSTKLERYKEVIVQNLSQIKKLDIWTGARHLKLYRLFLSLCTNLNELHWGDDQAATKDGNDFLFNYLLNPDENQALYKLIELRLDSIHREQTNKFFKTLIKLELRNIRRLALIDFSFREYNPIFEEFCETYNLLVSFTLGGCTERHLTNICQHMKNLSSITLNNCTANNLSQLLLLSNLEHIFIYGYDTSINVDLAVLLSSEHKLLKKLSVSNVDAKIFKLICMNCINLEELAIFGVGTKDCEPIFCSLVKLKKLTLLFDEPANMNSSRIKSSVQYNITNLSNLEEISISCFVPGITPELIKKLPKIRKGWECVWDPVDDVY